MIYRKRIVNDLSSLLLLLNYGILTVFYLKAYAAGITPQETFIRPKFSKDRFKTTND